MRVSHRGVPLTGLSRISADTLIFTPQDTLRADGSRDGRYDLLAELDLPSLGAASTRRAVFTIDSRPPDTASTLVEVSPSGVRVVAGFTDGGHYPDVGGIDRAATTLTIEEPGGRQLAPASSQWLDENTVEALFPALERAGFHRLELTVVDRAGWTTVRSRAVVNAFGAAQGGSVAFVEDVPARTRARIGFISGRVEGRIARATLRIFNLRGDLVRRLDASGQVREGRAVDAEWLLDNDGGQLVMNGVFIYYWEITYDDGKVERVRKTLAVAR